MNFPRHELTEEIFLEKKYVQQEYVQTAWEQQDAVVLERGSTRISI
jgi:hypothetical protein